MTVSFLTRIAREALIVCALGCAANAQQITPSAPFLADIGASRFRHTDSTGCVELAISCYSRLVTLRPDSIGYRGGVRLDLQILRKSDSARVMFDRMFVPLVIADTASAQMDQTFTVMLRYGLHFGEYFVVLVATDSLNPSRGIRSIRSLTMEPVGSSETLSDIQLCSSIGPQKQTASPFNKNTLEVIPNTSLVYGATSYPSLAYYTELYNLDPLKTYRVQFEIFDPAGKSVKQTARTRAYKVSNAVDFGSTIVTTIPSGRCRVQITLSDTLGKVFAKRDAVFFAHNPHVKQPETMVETAKAAELMGMTADELATEFRQVRYFATAEEIRLFESVTTESGRRNILAKLWADLEQGRSGMPPLTRIEYVARITSANQRFRSMGKEGWESDRGRVSLIYGEPDEIERTPSSEDQKPYEIWHYYQIENGVQFVFVDRSGFGDYLLVHSTKRGELQDPTWERYLR